MPSPSPRYLYTVFAESVRRWPANVAIEVGGVCRTYSDLSDDVDTLQRAIADGQRPPSRVLLDATKSYGTYVAYLAALGLGATVAPVSTESGPSRLKSMAQAMEADLFIYTRPSLEIEALNTYLSTVRVDGASGSVLARQDGSHHREESVHGDAEYVLFTSGSTGTPKGVPICARQIRPYLDRARSRYGVDQHARLSHTFELTFDLSIFDLFVTWSAGATLCVPQGRTAALVSNYVRTSALTHWFGVPSAITLASQLGGLAEDSGPDLRFALACGEPLRWSQAEGLARAFPNARLFNLYGPTELTISCADYELPTHALDRPSTRNQTVPIGHLHHQHEFMLLGRQGWDTDRGELCVRGPQRFDGYLGGAKRGETFVDEHGRAVARHMPNPGDLYRTGDLVEMTKDGLVHLGRNDSQVKVNGYRIELLEVEGALESLEGVDEAIVDVGEQAGFRRLLCAYRGDSLDESTVRRRLMSVVPKYMVPHLLLRFEELPRTPHGKLDRQAIGDALRAHVARNPENFHKSV